MMLSRRYQLVFLAFVVLGLYYPSLFAGATSVDDLRLIGRLEDFQFDWLGLFSPGKGFYYRPLLILTFRVDQWLWDLEPSFMHLENILIHLGNVILVYWIAARFMASLSGGRWNIRKIGPFLAALVFSVHPLATESVNWISGRTDLLGGFFVLLSTLFLLVALETGRYRHVFSAMLAFGVGACCKEVMVFFLPVALLLLWRYPALTQVGGRSFDRRRAMFLFCLPLVIGLIGFLIARWGVRGDAAISVGQLIEVNRYTPGDLLRVSLKVFGFYSKKLFWPFPLNFAIVSFSNHYVWLGLVALLLLSWMWVRRSRLVIPWMAVALLLIPALIIAITDVAWTPVAERYAYVPAAFWAVGAVCWLSMLVEKKGLRSVFSVLVVSLVAIFSVATVQRNLIWQDDQLLYADTLAKSPTHPGMRNELGIALLEKGYVDEAEAQFRKGMAETQGSNPLLYVNQARLYLRENEPEKARKLLLSVSNAPDFKGANSEVLKMLAKVDEMILLNATEYDQRQLLIHDLLKVYAAAYSASGDPVLLYRGGQMALKLGKNEKARELFKKAYCVAPKGAYYRAAAGKLAAKLGEGGDAQLD